MRTSDFVIIGGGVMGCSVAYQLAVRGHSVTVLERKHLASGASGKSAAVIRCHYSNEITTRMALLSRGVWEQFAERLGLDAAAGDVGWHQTGMVIVGNADTRSGLERNLAMQRSVGVRTEMISLADLRALEPRAHFSEDACGAFEPEAGYVDPVRATEAFATAARQQGAVIEEFTPVTGFEVAGGRVISAHTPRGSFQAGAYVLATGAWSARLGTALELELPITPQRAQLALFRQPVEFGHSHAVFADFGHMTYFKPLTAGHTTIGTIDDREARVVDDPDHLEENADPAVIEDLRTCLSSRLPLMRRAVNRGGWSGLYAVTPDWHPMLDRAPQLSNLYLCCGFSGHGFKLSPIVGQLMSELILGAGFRALDAHPLRFSRFAEQELIGRQYTAGVIG